MSRFSRSPGINETPVEDELFLIAVDSGDIYHLDQLAMSIWRALKEPASQAELQALFSQVFPDTPPATIEQDLIKALETLRSDALIAHDD
ncbi:MAG: PqqD family protein [Alphaproteobacteria bacterium]|jgi:flagellar biogenesis protein FliO|nr:PqqD family protein [Alphaproteobacteria bacterium]